MAETKRLRIESSSNETKDRKPPAGATIIERSINTTVEQIENGYLTTKNFSGRYRKKGSKKDDYGDWFEYSKKTYSKEDPVLLQAAEKELAEMFEEDED